jgi:hypothetical protein
MAIAYAFHQIGHDGIRLHTQAEFFQTLSIIPAANSP